MKFNNIVSFALIFAILITVFFNLFIFRWVFFNQYEPEYYENWYYHSQWNYPQSTRGISDGPLYQFVGYRLVQGENPFNINLEMPPFGKYLYGLTAEYLGNPYWTSFFLYLASFLVFFLLSKHLYKNNRITLLALILFVTTPFVATQLRETMLDLPLMFLYLVHVLFFIKFLQNKDFKSLVLAGIFLGVATATKPGVYTPLVLILGSSLVFLTSKKIFNSLFYTGSVFGGYVLAFFPVYFIRHPNPIPFIRLHEKPLRFYLSSNIQIDHLAQWKTIFLNLDQLLWLPGQKIGQSDWSPLLPLGVIAVIIVLFLAVKKRKLEWVYICGLGVIFLIINTFIPFWPRHLMPTVPLFILSIVFLLVSVKSLARYVIYIILLLSFLNLPFLVGSLTEEGLAGNSEAIARFVSTRAYRELYRSIQPAQRKNLAEQNFINILENFLEGLGTRSIVVKVKAVTKTKEGMNVRYQIIYTTKYGKLNHEPVLNFVKVHNQPKLIWKWDYLAAGFTPESKIVVAENAIPFLRMENSDGVVAKRGNWQVVYIIPRLMFDWNKSINALAEITGESSLEIDKRIKTVVPDQYPRFVGYLDPTLGEEEVNKALAIPGVSLKDVDFAVIPKNAKPKNEVSKTIRDLQKNQPELFYLGAEVYLENENGEKVPIPFPKSAQKDVVIKI